MAHENVAKVERMLDMGNGLAIWRLHLDSLREQRKNARGMEKPMFELLASTIGKDKRLEQLPFANRFTNQAGNVEFQIISGHHRVRAARTAGLAEVFVIVHEGELKRSEIISKQLAHNAISGKDDPQVLRELYEEIDLIEDRIASGIRPEDLKFEVETVKIDDVTIDLRYENVHLLFLPTQFKHFAEVLAKLEKGADLSLVPYETFEKFKELANKTSRFHNVRNLSAIFGKMLQIVDERLKLDEEALSAKQSVDDVVDAATGDDEDEE